MHSHRITYTLATLLGLTAHHLASAQDTAADTPSSIISAVSSQASTPNIAAATTAGGTIISEPSSQAPTVIPTPTTATTTATATATATNTSPTLLTPTANPNTTICRFNLVASDDLGRLQLLPNGTATLQPNDTLASPYDVFEILESGELRAVDLGSNEDVYEDGDLRCGFVDLSAAGGEGGEPYFHCWPRGGRGRVDNLDFTWRLGSGGRLVYRGVERFWWCEISSVGSAESSVEPDGGVLLSGVIDDGDLQAEVARECQEVSLQGLGCIGYTSDSGREDDGDEDGAGDGDEDGDDGDLGDENNAVQGSTGGGTDDSGASTRSGGMAAGLIAIAVWML